MSKEARRLGRGIASLVTTPQASVSDPPTDVAAAVVDSRLASLSHRLANIAVSQVRPNPAQPRKVFDEASIAALAASIRQRGTLQPIVVRPTDAGYELIAGERRLRAATLAGQETIPAIVRAVRDEEMLELALIENIQRENLNPVERARAYQALQSRHNLTPDQIAERMGEDRTTISNYIRILSLHSGVLEMVASGLISTGHAKSLLGISDKQGQLSVAEKIVAQGWSVRHTESVVSGRKSAAEQGGQFAKPIRPAVQDMEQKLSQAIGVRVRLREGRRRHTGKIVIEYRTLEDFDRVVSRLGLMPESA